MFENITRFEYGRSGKKREEDPPGRGCEMRKEK